MPRLPVIAPLAISLALAGCGEKTPDLPADPLDQAAACGVVAAATERQQAGAKGDLPAEGQLRILHYAMLYASTGRSLDPDKVNKVSARMPALFDQTIKGKWQALVPKCAALFPAAGVRQPTLPSKPLDSMLQCYVLADFLRKALSEQGGSYGLAANDYSALKDRLEAKLTPAMRAAGLHNGPALQQKRLEELAAATRLGQPPAVIGVCRKAYPGSGT